MSVFPGFSLAPAVDYPSWWDDENIPVADQKAAQHGFPITSYLLSSLRWYPLLTFQQLHSNMFTSAWPKADPYNGFRRSVRIFIANLGQTHTHSHRAWRLTLFLSVTRRKKPRKKSIFSKSNFLRDKSFYISLLLSEVYLRTGCISCCGYDSTKGCSQALGSTGKWLFSAVRLSGINNM